jgi:hypothetical protein
MEKDDLGERREFNQNFQDGEGSRIVLAQNAAGRPEPPRKLKPGEWDSKIRGYNFAGGGGISLPSVFLI